jgi:hypothetical protein
LGYNATDIGKDLVDPTICDCTSRYLTLYTPFAFP